ncbi:MAG: hypothetical protein IJ601_04535 [Acidaminococcaceae bacterium]|nr:hypothetical protein [Acidaminococcaceae bacterium]
MENCLMPVLAKHLGLELGERFRIRIDGHVNELTEFWFTEKDLLYNTPPDKKGISGVRPASDQTVAGLLHGNYEVVKLNWTPKLGEHYWYVTLTSDTNYPQTAYGEMRENVLGLLNLIHGNYFKTQEEAEAKKREFVAIIKAMYLSKKRFKAMYLSQKRFREKILPLLALF